MDFKLQHTKFPW